MNASAPPQNEEEEEKKKETEDNNNDNQGFDQLSSPLDSIMGSALLSPSSATSSDKSETPLVSKDNDNEAMMSKPMGHQTIDMDHFLDSKANITHPAMYNAVHSKIKEDEEDDVDNEDHEDEESMGSEIIHDTPRNLHLLPKHEKLDPAIFGKDESEETSSNEDAESYGTDPNGY